MMLMGPKWVKKISPTPLHHQQQFKLVIRGRVLCGYHPNVAAKIEIHLTRKLFPNLLLFNIIDPVLIIASCS